MNQNAPPSPWILLVAGLAFLAYDHFSNASPSPAPAPIPVPAGAPDLFPVFAGAQDHGQAKRDAIELGQFAASQAAIIKIDAEKVPGSDNPPRLNRIADVDDFRQLCLDYSARKWAAKDRYPLWDQTVGAWLNGKLETTDRELAPTDKQKWCDALNTLAQACQAAAARL